MALVREVTIENYKPIRKLTIEPARVNVLIGANGSGKSNLLEAIALGAAAAREKLDNEYLVPRGIRVAEPRFMRSAFPGSEADGPVVISFQVAGEGATRFAVNPERRTIAKPKELLDIVIAEMNRRRPTVRGNDRLRKIAEKKYWAAIPSDFLIYAPENSALRIFQAELQVLPLGVKGEGLFAHLKALGGSKHDADRLAAIGDRLALLDWFERLEIPKDLAPGSGAS